VATLVGIGGPCEVLQGYYMVRPEPAEGAPSSVSAAALSGDTPDAVLSYSGHEGDLPDFMSRRRHKPNAVPLRPCGKVSNCARLPFG
jgi:hypothetical protein